MDEYPRLRIAGIEPESFVDGPGIRMTIFTQGCHHNCPGCQNPQTHDFNGGRFSDVEEVVAALDENPLYDGVTFSGGDPMDQAEALVPYARAIKERLIELAAGRPGFTELLSYADILIDGPFIMAKKSLELKFRGSSNQRIIDVPKSLVEGHVVLHRIQLEEMKERPDLVPA